MYMYMYVGRTESCTLSITYIINGVICVNVHWHITGKAEEVVCTE